LPGEIEAALPAWIAGDMRAAETLKVGRVWRSGAWAVKRYPRPKTLLARLRRPPALRTAELHFAIAPVRSPMPVCALRLPAEESLLVSEFVEGGFVHVLWSEDPEARAALPRFVADMHQAGVFHGDLHAGNMIWNGEAWYLIDLDGLRHRLRVLVPARRRLVIDQWGRLLLSVKGRAGMRPLFEEYLVLMGLEWSRDEAWAAVEREALRACESRFGPGSWPGP
jgi:hypothetical protein